VVEQADRSRWCICWLIQFSQDVVAGRACQRRHSLEQRPEQSWVMSDSPSGVAAFSLAIRMPWLLPTAAPLPWQDFLRFRRAATLRSSSAWRASKQKLPAGPGRRPEALAGHRVTKCRDRRPEPRTPG